MNTRRAVVGVAALAGVYAAVHRVASTWGATATERRVELPGDGLVPRPLVQSTHGVTMATPVSVVWPLVRDAAGEREAVADIDPERALVLVSVRPVPQWTRVDVSRSFVLSEQSDGTRLVVRTRAWLAPWWLAAGAALAFLPFDLVATRRLFRRLASVQVSERSARPMEPSSTH